MLSEDKEELWFAVKIAKTYLLEIMHNLLIMVYQIMNLYMEFSLNLQYQDVVVITDIVLYLYWSLQYSSVLVHWIAKALPVDSIWTDIKSIS